jgi:hypothetical protein
LCGATVNIYIEPCADLGAQSSAFNSKEVSVSWLSDFAEAVEDVVETVGDAVGNAVEAVGDAINDGANWLGGQTGAVGGAIFGWIGDVAKGALDLVGATIKASFGMVAGSLGGPMKILDGIVTLDGDLILEGLGDIFSPIVGGTLLILGKTAASFQIIFTVGATRRLTRGERRQLERVYRDSLNYHVIWISEGHAGIFELGGGDRFVLGNTIYFRNSEVKIEYLVHEACHVWQYQNDGARYIADNMYAQATADNFHAEDVYVNEINAGKTQWSDFHPEAQAELIEGLWMEGELLNGAIPAPMGNGVFYDATDVVPGRFVHNKVDYTPIANDAVATLRAA